MTTTGMPGDGDSMLGREAEHAVAMGFLDAVAYGPAALVITGPAGIGKSTVLRSLVAGARDRGWRTMETRAVEAEAQLAFGGLADLLDPWLDSVEDRLPPAQRLALGVALQRLPVGDSPPPPLAVSLGTLAVLRAVAEEAPVVVAVDDLSWLDGPSARVLAYALRRLDDAHVAFVATVRTDDPDAELSDVATALAAPVRRMHLQALDLAAIDALVHREVGLSLRRPALAWLHGVSGGNPFFALEIARAMQRTGGRPGFEGLALSTSTGALVRERLAALPVSTLWPLAAAAALGQPLITTLTVAYPDAPAALEVARSARVVELDGGMVRFTHPLLAAGAYGSLDTAGRRQLHRRLAEAVPEPEQRARHLALATDRPSEEVAAELERAAVHARARGGSDAAAELWLHAAMRTPVEDPDGIRRRTIAAGGFFIQAGDPTRARAVLEEYVAATAPGPGRADALRVLADARSSDDWPAKVRLLEQALEEAGQDHRLRSEILQALAQASRFTLRGASLEVELATAAVAEAEAQDDPVARCSAYLTAVFAHHSTGDGLAADLLGRARALAPEVQHLRIFMQPAFCEALIDEADDRLEPAAASLAVLQASAEAAGDWDSLPLITTNLADVEYRLGAWQAAHAHAVEGERGARVNGQALALAFALHARALVEIGLGRTADGRRTADEALALTREIGVVAPGHAVSTTLGRLALEQGDLEGAVAELRLAMDAERAAGYGTPQILFGVPPLAEALVALDRAGEAAAAIAYYEAAARRLDRPSALAASHRVRGLIATAAGDEERAVSEFADALAEHGRVPEPFERAQTLLAQGEALRRFRRRGQAREALEAAIEIFDRLGAAGWRERAARALARTGHRESGDSLTPTERQVAELAAAGRTNREVAEQLFMSPHTVEAHLTRVYRSLGVRGRTALARALPPHDEGHG